MCFSEQADVLAGIAGRVFMETTQSQNDFTLDASLPGVLASTLAKCDVKPMKDGGEV